MRWRLWVYLLLIPLVTGPAALYFVMGGGTEWPPLMTQGILTAIEDTADRTLLISNATNRRKIKPYLDLLRKDYQGIYIADRRSAVTIGSLKPQGAADCFTMLGTRRHVVHRGVRCLTTRQGHLRMALMPASKPWSGFVWLLLLGLPLLLVAGVITLIERHLRALSAFGEQLKWAARDELPKIVPINSRGELDPLEEALAVMVAHIKEKEESLASQLTLITTRQEQLQRSERSLVKREKMITLGNLSAGLAHELGNPLAALMGLLELTREGDLPPEVMAENYALMERELSRMDTLITRLLEYARPSSRQVTAQDPLPMIAQAMDLLSATKERRGIIFTNRLPDSFPPVMCSDDLVGVLLNLFINAAQAQGGEGTITLFSESDDTSLTLFVSDEGPGIPADLHETVFEPFFTTKAPGEGTGLGLGLARGIVEQMGGTLTLVETGKGACFAITLFTPKPPEPEVK